MNEQVAGWIREDELLTLQITRSEAREIQKMVWLKVLKSESELQGLRENNSYTMPQQLVKMPIHDRKCHIDPWCSLVMWWRNLNDILLNAIEATTQKRMTNPAIQSPTELPTVQPVRADSSDCAAG